MEVQLVNNIVATNPQVLECFAAAAAVAVVVVVYK